MTDVVARARIFLIAVAAPLLLTLPVAQAAPTKLPTAHTTKKPSPTVQGKLPPGAKPTVIPPGLQPVPDTSPQIDPRLAKELRKPRNLSDAQISAIAKRFSIDANPHDVVQATTLTVRRPYRGPGAYLTFPHSEAVRTEVHPDGVATMASGGRVRRVRGTGPAIDPVDFEDAEHHYDPLHPDFPPGADATIDGSFVGIHLVAAPNRDYVVSCRISGGSTSAAPARTYGARVEVGGRYSHMIRDLIVDNGRVSFAVPRAPNQRGVDLQVFAYGRNTLAIGRAYSLAAFSVSRCDINPIT